MQIRFVAADTPLEAFDGTVILGVGQTGSQTGSEASATFGGLDGLQDSTRALVLRQIELARFKADPGNRLVALGVAETKALVLIGVGPQSGLTSAGIERAGAEAFRAARALEASGLMVLDHLEPQLAASAAFGALLASYRFDSYRTKGLDRLTARLQTLDIRTSDPVAARAAFDPLEALASGVFLARDLASEPANVLYPVSFAERIRSTAPDGLEVEILDIAQMEALGMHSLLGVGQGSSRESRMVILRWNGAADAEAAPLALVGKGVCFDTGGISIKPADSMEDMKWDMGGAAAVSGAMFALARRKAKANVVGILGLVENMPDGNAQRPGDVVRSMSGQTIEVINTDAEGRLVLADALWYCKERFKPCAMVDLATLTGAIIIALGHDYAGLFSNDDQLAGRLSAAGEGEQERVWRLPMPDSYDKQIDSKIADMKNVGGRPAGSITAALFLKRFVGNVPWAHLDIAATAWRKSDDLPTVPEGGTGFGVRLLNRLVADHYEDPSPAK